MSENDLTTNQTHPIIRVGNEIHRPTEFWTPAVHDLLKYLESIEFPYSPHVIGTDDEGREVLTYIEGESGAAGWEKILSDEGLANYAKFLRTYHDAVAQYTPPPNLEWANGAKAILDGQIICHGDFGPWNLVWNGIEPIGIVDWDLVHPNKPEYDILYCLEYSAPFRDDKTALEFHHFKGAPNRKHRIQVFLEAYGSSPIENVPQRVADLQREVGKYEGYLASRGIQPQADWVANGDLDEVEKRAQWSETHANLF